NPVYKVAVSVNKKIEYERIPNEPGTSHGRSKAGENEAVALQFQQRAASACGKCCSLQPARPAPSLTEPGNVTLSPPPWCIDPGHVQRWNISRDISSRLVDEEGTEAAVALKMKLSAVLVLSWTRIL
ncbi:hypothetical protein EK904_009991, partial [Melospiza melodia maxima]